MADDERLDRYLHERFLGDDELLLALVDEETRRAMPIHLNADTARLVQVLVAATAPRRVLEVGTLFGYSAITIARALPPDGHIDSVEREDAHADAAEGWFRRAGVADRVTVHRGAALHVLATLQGPYDVALIDAAKPEYPAYLEHAMRLVRRGGVILADNVVWRGTVADPSVDDDNIRGIRAYVDRIATDARLLSTVVTVGDGLAVSVVR